MTMREDDTFTEAELMCSYAKNTHTHTHIHTHTRTSLKCIIQSTRVPLYNFKTTADIIFSRENAKYPFSLTHKHYGEEIPEPNEAGSAVECELVSTYACPGDGSTST